MESIRIDSSRYNAEFGRSPCEGEVGVWTFLVAGKPVTVYGSYAEATSRARLHVRLAGLDVHQIELAGRGPSGQVRIGLG